MFAPKSDKVALPKQAASHVSNTMAGIPEEAYGDSEDDTGGNAVTNDTDVAEFATSEMAVENGRNRRASCLIGFEAKYI